MRHLARRVTALVEGWLRVVIEAIFISNMHGRCTVSARIIRLEEPPPPADAMLSI
jgi:hypothetical protein